MMIHVELYTLGMYQQVSISRYQSDLDTSLTPQTLKEIIHSRSKYYD